MAVVGEWAGRRACFFANVVGLRMCSRRRTHARILNVGVRGRRLSACACAVVGVLIATFYVKITQPFLPPEIITIRNPVKFLKIHNFFILDPILDPKIVLECSTKIDFSYDTFSLIEKVSKQR